MGEKKHTYRSLFSASIGIRQSRSESKLSLRQAVVKLVQNFELRLLSVFVRKTPLRIHSHND